MLNNTHKKQILAFCSIAAGIELISSAYNFYYVKIFLNFYHIEQPWFQFAQILFMIWNAVNDPLFAYCADNKNFQIVKTRRNIILYSAPFFAISFLIPWFQWGTDSVIVGIHLIVGLCLWDTLYTIVGLAYCCLFTEISQDTSKRIHLTRYSTAASLFGSCSVLILEHTSNGLKNFHAFQITTVFIAITSCLLMYYCGKNCHTQYDLDQMRLAEKGSDEICHLKDNESFLKQTWQLLTDINFLSFVVTNFLQQFHRTFLASFLAIICDQLISTEDISQGSRSTFYGAVPLSSKVMIILFAPLVEYFSYRKVIQGNFIWKICGGLTLYFFIGEEHPWKLMCFLLLDQCFADATFSLFNLPLSDIADNNMEKYKRKHPISSMVYGTNALIVKPAISLSPMLVVAILNKYGYSELKNMTEASTSTMKGNTSPASSSQLEDLKCVMFTLVCWYPVILGFIQFCSWSFFTNKKRQMATSKME